MYAKQLADHMIRVMEQLPATTVATAWRPRIPTQGVCVCVCVENEFSSGRHH